MSWVWPLKMRGCRHQAAHAQWMPSGIPAALSMVVDTVISNDDHRAVMFRWAAGDSPAGRLAYTGVWHVARVSATGTRLETSAFCGICYWEAAAGVCPRYCTPAMRPVAEEVARDCTPALGPGSTCFRVRVFCIITG